MFASTNIDELIRIGESLTIEYKRNVLIRQLELKYGLSNDEKNHILSAANKKTLLYAHNNN